MVSRVADVVRYRDNITEKVEKIMFGKFVSLYLCPGVKKSVKTAHRGSPYVRWVLFSILKKSQLLGIQKFKPEKKFEK